jgi:hypothetical protein
VAASAQLQRDELQRPIKQLTSLVSKEILVFVEVFNKPKQQQQNNNKKQWEEGKGRRRGSFLKADGRVPIAAALRLPGNRYG